MDWTYRGEPIDEKSLYNFAGFVYIITNLVDGRRYVGKKLLTKARTRTIKKKKKRDRVPSDWKTYYGSNKELQSDVASLGEENFSREILWLCRTKGECSYMEIKEQLERDVLRREDYYNSWISCKISRSHLPSSKE